MTSLADFEVTEFGMDGLLVRSGKAAKLTYGFSMLLELDGV